jgi:hypothetical protein
VGLDWSSGAPLREELAVGDELEDELPQAAAMHSEAAQSRINLGFTRHILHYTRPARRAQTGIIVLGGLTGMRLANARSQLLGTPLLA